MAGTSVVALSQSPVAPNSNATSDLTISQVVQDAQNNYPAIHVSEAELNAAVANIRLPRTSHLPRLDRIHEMNSATRSNVFGTLLPQTIIPSISGPVLG